MSNVENSTRAPFFPGTKTSSETRLEQLKKRQSVAKRNDVDRASELKTMTEKDAKVDINSGIKDFSRIKKAVDAAPDADKSEQIADLKARIKDGKYSIDYESIADKMIAESF